MHCTDTAQSSTTVSGRPSSVDLLCANGARTKRYIMKNRRKTDKICVIHTVIRPTNARKVRLEISCNMCEEPAARVRRSDCPVSPVRRTETYNTTLISSDLVSRRECDRSQTGYSYKYLLCIHLWSSSRAAWARQQERVSLGSVARSRSNCRFLWIAIFRIFRRFEIASPPPFSIHPLLQSWPSRSRSAFFFLPVFSKSRSPSISETISSTNTDSGAGGMSHIGTPNLKRRTHLYKVGKRQCSARR